MVTQVLCPISAWCRSRQVLIIHRPNSQRRVLNLHQLLAACIAWVPPPGGPARRTRCTLHQFRDDAVVEDLAALRRADVLVRSMSACSQQAKSCTSLGAGVLVET